MFLAGSRTRRTTPNTTQPTAEVAIQHDSKPDPEQDSGSNATPDAHAFYSVSVSPGSGKTYGLSQWLAGSGPEQQFRNTIILVPTLRLLEQTEADLRETFRQAGSWRKVESISSTSGRRQSVASEAIPRISNATPDTGLTIIMASAGFLQTVGQLSDKTKARWQVFADESLTAWSWDRIPLGTHPEMRIRNRDQLFTLFTWDDHQDDFPQVRPQAGMADMVEAVANGEERRVGRAYMHYRELAAHVTNPATSTERVQYSESCLTVANVVRASAFAGFDSMTILGADLESSPLHAFWEAQGVTFTPHAGIHSFISGEMCEDQGPYLSFGHLLPSGQTASKTACQRDYETGRMSTRSNPVPPERTTIVVALNHYLNRFRATDPTEEVAIATSPGLEPERDILPYLQHPAIVHMGCDVRGLNNYRQLKVLANVPACNPTPEQTSWIVDRLGVTVDRARDLMRYPVIQQATGRLTRDRTSTHRRVVVTLSEADAWKSHQYHPGSHWLGDMAELQQTSRRAPGRPKAETKMSDLPEYKPTRDRLRSLNNKQRNREKKGKTLGPEDVVEMKQLQARLAEMREAVS